MWKIFKQHSLSKDVKILFILFLGIVIAGVYSYFIFDASYSRRHKLCESAYEVLQQVPDMVDYVKPVVYPKVKKREMIDLSVKKDLMTVLMRLDQEGWHQLTTTLPEKHGYQIQHLINEYRGYKDDNETWQSDQYI